MRLLSSSFRVSAPSASSAGFTLVEMLMSFTILSVGVLGFIGAFMTVSKSIQSSKTRAVANSLLQEKIEALKDVSYYRLVPTTAPVTSTESGIDVFQYNTGFYPPETLQVGDVAYIRRVFVEKVSSGGGGTPASLPHQAPDSGLKRIKSYVLWQTQGNWNMQELQNLVNNPNRQRLEGEVQGTVSISGGGSPNEAVVMILQNASRFDAADTAGAYDFYVAPGTYTLEASLPGCFPLSLQSANILENTPYTWNPILTKMSSGTVTGTAYIRDHLVISQVVGRHDYAGAKQEWVEVYNPTTWTWTTSDLGLKFQRVSSIDAAPVNIFLTAPVAGAASIPPSGFLLFANTTTITLASLPGFPVTASVLWSTAPGTNDVAFSDRFTAADPNIITTYNDNNQWGAGGLQLYRISDGRVQDTVGWKGNGASTIPPLKEGSAMNYSQGLNTNEQFYRFSNATSYNPANGPAYDTQDSDDDWELQNPAGWLPKSHASGTAAPTTGTPAAGAFVSADDGLSEPVTANAAGGFTLPAVATGTWNVSFSTGSLYKQMTAPAITTPNQTVSLGTVAITSTTQFGFVTGIVRSAQSNNPVPGITIQDASGTPAVTGAGGRYSMTLSTGITYLTANPGNTNANYVSESVSNVMVDMGVYTTGVDFSLGTGGRIRGRVMIGSNPLPGIPTSASDGTTVRSESVSDANGYFYLSNLSTGSYTVEAQLESGETYSPGPSTATLTNPGDLIDVGTFTITSAFGWARGTLYTGTKPIRTGVMVFGSTSTLAGYPPDMDNSLRTGVQKYYAVSSFTDGTYELALPGGNSGTPINYYIYAWYTTWNGTTPVVVRKQTTAAIIGETVTSGRDMTW